MIQNGFIYIAVLIFVAALIVNLPHIFTGKKAKLFFSFAPPIVLMYLGFMLLCTIRLWNLETTSDTYSNLKNPILYTMLFLMLLRCDLRKIIKLGPRMLFGFFLATVSIGLGFIISYWMFGGALGADSWKALGALCGSWMGGGGNMMAVQAALNVDEATMAYALVMDSVCATIYVMFLLWIVSRADQLNDWIGADTRRIDEVGMALQSQIQAEDKKLTWQNIMILLGSGLLASGLCQELGVWTYNYIPFFDKTTWTVLYVTLIGVLAALTPFGKLRGTEELSTVLLYTVIALIASRADLLSIGNAPIWLLAGFVILIIHVLIMVGGAKLFHIDVFTCCVASLANVGGTATAPVLAGAYSSVLVPVGIIMALLGYVVGTGGGLLVAELMHIIGD